MWASTGLKALAFAMAFAWKWIRRVIIDDRKSSCRKVCRGGRITSQKPRLAPAGAFLRRAINRRLAGHLRRRRRSHGFF
jgi:hypothetical protein